MARRFGLAEVEMPTLQQVQWFVGNYMKNRMHRNEDYDDILDQISQLEFRPDVSETQPFSFGWQRDRQGRPEVGNGSDENPFLVGSTTKCLLRNATRDPTSFVFHTDGTIKLNQVGYPVIICDVSDRARSFHLVTMFISSQRLGALCVRALAVLRKIYIAVTSQQLIVKYVMADAEAAQLNAVSQGFGMDSNLTYLMCFYHVMAKVHERLKGFPNFSDLQFAASKEVYNELVVSVLAKWSRDTQFLTLQNYFTSVWMNMLSHTKLLTTNNPVKQCNRLIKREYTRWTKHKIGTLIGLLAECLEVSQTTQQLRARVNDFRRRDLLQDVSPSRSSIEFLLVSPNPDKFCVLSHGCHRVFLPELGRSREVAPSRLKWELTMTEWGYQFNPMVDVSKLSCGCKYHFKVGICIHVHLALEIKYYSGLDGKRPLVNRSAPRKRSQPAKTRTLLDKAAASPSPDAGRLIKRLLDAIPHARIAKIRPIEAALQGNDAGKEEWVLPTGVDLNGVGVNGKTLFLTSWEPTLEPTENLPPNEIKKYRQRKRRIVKGYMRLWRDKNRDDSMAPRVTLRLFLIPFAPQSIMTDADKAQHRACKGELPTAKIQMCLFHVCQHAGKASKTLSTQKRELIFRGLNDLHFCRTQVEFETKKSIITSEWPIVGQPSRRFRAASKNLIRQWFDNPRFFRLAIIPYSSRLPNYKQPRRAIPSNY
ncbi:hypothetical protein PHMEG_0008939 [Phytophthora megakarya]|uniref:SWIM-type domain-containing protein n=1 Tax=Phytophthora megakarya TaxID=4795 RepID=A0A225WHE1_9STRA|nr:hypothetical protein PHMEG_0008939 [Phytophthora megakarya]